MPCFRMFIRLVACMFVLATTVTPARAGQPGDFGTLSIQVRPPGADVFIDGERWVGTGETGGPLQVQLAPGPHRVELRSPGRRPYVADVTIHAGETTPLNVALSPSAAPRPEGPPPARAMPPSPGPPPPPSGITEVFNDEDGPVF